MSSRRRTLDPELTILGGRDFVGLVGRLCREQNWEALIAVFGAVGSREKEMAYVSLTDLDTATRVLADARGGALGPAWQGQARQEQAGRRGRGRRAGRAPHRGRGRAHGAQQSAAADRAGTPHLEPGGVAARASGRPAGAPRWRTRSWATNRGPRAPGARWATSTAWKRRWGATSSGGPRGATPSTPSAASKRC